VRELLLFLLTAPPEAPSALSLEDVFREQRARTASLPSAIDRAIASGFLSDRLGYAFAAGYGAALHALAPGFVDQRAVAFCATEDDGAHPKAIRTSLTEAPGGGLLMSGRKRWATLAPYATELLVVASIGVDASLKNRLRVVRVDAGAPGVTVTAMPAPPFTPEILHAEVTLADVLVREGDVLPGDGYDDYLKPFRTIEDVNVHAALLGYLVGVGRRSGWPEAAIERLVALVICARSIASLEPKAPEAHVALAGLLGETRRLVTDVEELWAVAPAEERARWDRDKPLLRVAERAREARRARAWEVISAAKGGGE
jgi:hypothetical protein